jgi:hypothetical protein
MRRSSREVAVQSIIFGSLGFRASLEVTVHPRSGSLCSQLLPWLEQYNLADGIEEFHREILETPYRALTRESQTEGYWRGEAAMLLGWAIQLFDKPNPTVAVDTGVLVDKLRIFQPNVNDLVACAKLRSETEIDDYCAFCLTVRHRFQVSVLEPDGQAALKRIHQSRLAELGLSEAFHGRKDFEIEAAQLASIVPSVKGLYVVRAMAAEWLLGEDL